MPQFEIARYRYQDRMTVLGFVQDALHRADAPLMDPSGSVVVAVTVTPPLTDAEIPPDAARGCATKV